MKRKYIISFLLFMSCLVGIKAQPRPTHTRLDLGWEFIQQDLGGIWEAVRDARPTRPEAVPLWHSVTLPHCFNAENSVDPDLNYYEGPGWYRQNLSLDNPYPGGRTLLHFEGSGQRTEVYVYTTLVDSHVGGYDEFTMDITDAVAAFRQQEDAARFHGSIPVSIRVDNTRDLETIPSDMSDFNLYGGIYRHLNLVYVPALYVETVQVDAQVDSKGKEGKATFAVSFADHARLPGATVHLRVEGPDGKIVLDREARLDNFTGLCTVGDITIKKPALWSPASPNLYTATFTLHSDAGEQILTDRFGFRHFEFVEKGPFLLNGERLLLQGVHRHEDHAGVAAALTDEMIRTEMKQIRDMGANFIRLGHYQQSRLVLELCDELGIMVWEEIPWCRGGLGGPEYREQGKRMLRNMIAQHRNHPSIILWGLGNENDWPGDFPEFDRDAIRAYMQELHNLSHELDDSRLTAIRRCGFCKDIVDVYSPSIWAGWYKGAYVDYKSVSHAEMLGVDRFLHVEWGVDSHAGRFAEDPHIHIAYRPEPAQVEIVPGKPEYTAGPNNSTVGEWSESYAAELIDWTLSQQYDMPWLTGTAYWSFKDFSTPLRPENPVPYVNQKGLIERDGTPKEAYYVFQSFWTEKPMVRIFGHNWAVRWGKPGESKRLLVYSNCDEAELFLNGQSLGTKKRIDGDFPANGLRWDTPFAEGKNEVRVIARQGRTEVADEIAFEYQTAEWSVPAQLKTIISPAEDGYVWVETQLVDKDGIRCLDARNYIDFELAGDGQLLQNLGISSGCRRLQALNGRARIKVRLNEGESVVAVKSEGISTVFVIVK